MTTQTDLEAKLHRQAATNHQMQRAAEEKNIMLDTLHMVWCDGGCASGMHRYDGKPEVVTDALVDEAVRSLARVLADETVAKHIQYAAVQYVGRLIRWRRSRMYREATKQV